MLMIMLLNWIAVENGSRGLKVGQIFFVKPQVVVTFGWQTLKAKSYETPYPTIGWQQPLFKQIRLLVVYLICTIYSMPSRFYK